MGINHQYITLHACQGTGRKKEGLGAGPGGGGGGGGLGFGRVGAAFEDDIHQVVEADLATPDGEVAVGGADARADGGAVHEGVCEDSTARRQRSARKARGRLEEGSRKARGRLEASSSGSPVLTMKKWSASSPCRNTTPPFG